MTIRGPLTWSAAAAEGLKDTFFGYEHLMREGVISGKMQLWMVNDDSWMITEIARDGDIGFLLVWCYQGRRLINTMMHMNNVALSNNLQEVRFYTRLRAAVRGLRFMNPVLVPGFDVNEVYFRIKAKRYECSA